MQGLTGQQGEDERDAGLNLGRRRRAHGHDGADGDQANALLLRELARRLLREHLRDRVRLHQHQFVIV
jgi:hypothetical protein